MTAADFDRELNALTAREGDARRTALHFPAEDVLDFAQIGNQRAGPFNLGKPVRWECVPAVGKSRSAEPPRGDGPLCCAALIGVLSALPHKRGDRFTLITLHLLQRVQF
jgi:hypothetical protein